MRAAAAMVVALAAAGAAAQTMPPDRAFSRGLVYTEDAATVDVESRQSVTIDLSGTFSATLTPEISVDRTTWRAVQFLNLATGARSATVAAAGAYLVTPTSGAKLVRARASTWASGTATVFIRASSAVPASPPDVTAVGGQQVTWIPCTWDAESTGIVADSRMETAIANLRLKCWTAKETAGVPATAVLRHGAAETCAGSPFAYINLAANQSTGDCQDSVASSGVCVDWLTGTLSLNICTATEATP